MVGLKKEAYRITAALAVFAHIKAYASDGCGETLFSQPFMLV